jgi:hypothetical protein
MAKRHIPDLCICMIIALLPSTIVSACESSSMRPWVTCELSLCFAFFLCNDDMRRLFVILAETAVKVLVRILLDWEIAICELLTEETDASKASFLSRFLAAASAKGVASIVRDTRIVRGGGVVVLCLAG